jgi:hypothetical protein
VTRLRYVEFREDIALPGYSMISNVVEYDPAISNQPRAFELDLDLKTRLIRISVPVARVKQRDIGRWFHKENGKPNYGMGRVSYVPLEQVRRFEVSGDVDEEAPAPPSG